MEDNKKRLLPIGSVVKLKDEGDRDYMIYGRKVYDDQKRLWDYIVCSYPEGYMLTGPLSGIWCVNCDMISKLVFIGYQNAREERFREFLEQDNLEELTWDMEKGGRYERG